MNIIRNIEGATLLSVGAFCAAAVTSIVLHSAFPAQQEVMVSKNVIELPPVVITGKRISAIGKTQMDAAHLAG